MESPGARWDTRYGASDEYVFGTEPNDFLREQAAGLAPGDALCVADGEGRNGVWLAENGHRVTSVDLSEVGLAKAADLASARGVEIETVQADLAEYDFGVERWDLIVVVFAHMPPPIKQRMRRGIVAGLRRGGRVIIECYTPAQAPRPTGGPPDPDLTWTLAEVEADFDGLDIVTGVELDREVVEGAGHSGLASVVQVVATKP